MEWNVTMRTKPVYRSRYIVDEKPITFQQYIAETMCERLAKKNGTDLPVRFWQNPRWGKEFRKQVLAVNSLLKLYCPAAIILALRATPNLYSLCATWFDDILKEKQCAIQPILDTDTQAQEEWAELKAQATKPRPTFNPKSSTLNKLRKESE